MNKPFLQIQNLTVSVFNTNIINNLTLEIQNKGEIHIIMGPNGSGKSTLSKVIAGHPAYDIIDGKILFNSKKGLIDITKMEPSKRALNGIFLGFQNPIEVPGISNLKFLEEIYKEHSIARNDLIKYKNIQLENKLLELSKKINKNIDFLYRDVNSGFSGGEKKRNELLQLLLLQPQLIILDEIDSGLDINSMQIATEIIEELASNNSSIIIISHYTNFIKKLSELNKKTVFHIMNNGNIIKSGNIEILKEIEKTGFKKIE